MTSRVFHGIRSTESHLLQFGDVLYARSVSLDVSLASQRHGVHKVEDMTCRQIICHAVQINFNRE